MKLLFDEMYPSYIAREFARAHDVAIHETPGRGTPDEDVLDHARSVGGAVVTENVRNYRPLAEALLAAGDGHAGLVFTTDKRWPRSDPGVLITAFGKLLTAERRNLALIVRATLSGCGRTSPDVARGTTARQRMRSVGALGQD